MSDISGAIKAVATNEQRPLADVKREFGGGLYRAGATGRGLMRSGGFTVPPQLIAALTPAISQLASEGAKKLPGLISKGVSKVGKFFKKLFGLGLMRSGGLRDRHMDFSEDGVYHDMTNISNMDPADYIPSHMLKFNKYKKRASKIKGGFSQSDVPRIIEMINGNEKFRGKLERHSKRPHKFINAIVKQLKKN